MAIDKELNQLLRTMDIAKDFSAYRQLIKLSYALGTLRYEISLLHPDVRETAKSIIEKIERDVLGEST